MNEILIAILIPIILAGIAYTIAEFLMKSLKINHPKNMFLIYFIIFIIALLLLPVTALSYSEAVETTSNNTPTIDESDQFSELDLHNLTSTPISSRITPISSDNQATAGSFPSKYILEISWYDIITDENDETKPTETENTNAESDGQMGPSFTFITSLINSIPPFILLTSFLTVLSMVFVIYQLFILKYTYLKKIQAKICTNKTVNHLVKDLSKELEISLPKIFLYDGRPNAFIMGSPTVLVISNQLVQMLSENELRTTIRHELTHIKQKDVLLKAFIQATRIICFYNPFLHLIAKKIFNKRELLADSRYNTNQKDKISFMEALIKITEYVQSTSSLKKIPNPVISVSLIELSSYHPSMTERFISLFKQCRKKTLLTLMVSIIIIFTNFSGFVISQSYFQPEVSQNSLQNELVNVEEQYLVEKISYTTIYKQNEPIQGKMIHRTLYNVISIPTFVNQTMIKEIIDYVLLSYYKNQMTDTAF